MTLPPSGYHARALTFGCMAKGKGVSSRANLIIIVKVLVGNIVSSSHHAKAMSFGYPLNKKKNEEEKENKQNNKGKKGLGKNCIHDRYNSPSTKAPIGNIMHLWLSLYQYVWTSLKLLHLIYMAWMKPLGNFPFLMDTIPIRYLVLFLDLAL
jgi:hypothetical protein